MDNYFTATGLLVSKSLFNDKVLLTRRIFFPMAYSLAAEV